MIEKINYILTFHLNKHDQIILLQIHSILIFLFFMYQFVFYYYKECQYFFGFLFHISFLTNFILINLWNLYWIFIPDNYLPFSDRLLSCHLEITQIEGNFYIIYILFLLFTFLLSDINKKNIEKIY